MILFILLLVLFSFILTWLVRLFAIRRSIIDLPNERSSHNLPTPRGGGMAIAIIWFSALIYLFITDNIKPELFYALLAGLPLAIIGFADDIFNLKPYLRIIVQIFSASLALYFLEGLKIIQFGSFSLNVSFILIFIAFLGIIWYINLFNFLDGIDGYISSEIIFIGVAVFLLTGSQTLLLLAAANLGFLIWNWQRAIIFMGDAGSTLIGFTVAIFAIYHQNNVFLTLPVWLILTSVFWFDATITLFRRILNREKLSHAHRKHAYQRIVQSGFSHQKTVLWSILINVTGFGFSWLANKYVLYDWILLLIFLCFLSVIMKYVDSRKGFEYSTA